MKIQNNIDKIFLCIIYLPLLPIALMLVGWWTSYALLPQSVIPTFTIVGFILGCLLNIVVLPKLLKLGYGLPKWLLVIIFMFYTIGIFGFFMGVPLFNVIPVILAGFYLGRRNLLRSENIHGAVFVMLIMFLICCASAYLALRDPYTGANLRGMFQLPFTITQNHIWAIILIGGTGLLITALAGYKLAYRYALKLTAKL